MSTGASSGDGMHNADADADGLLSTKSPTSTYVNATPFPP